MDVQIACPCPPVVTKLRDGDSPGPDHTKARHPDGDTITLRDRLDSHSATTIRKALSLVESDDPRTRSAEILATLTEFYILMGVSSWTFVGADDKFVEVSHGAIRSYLLESPDIDRLSDAADDLYNQAILLPLLARASTSSPPTPTDESTSAQTDSSTPPPTPLKPSSTTTSRTGATETTSTSLVGASNSSQNSQSAA